MKGESQRTLYNAVVVLDEVCSAQLRGEALRLDSGHVRWKKGGKAVHETAAVYVSCSAAALAAVPAPDVTPSTPSGGASATEGTHGVTPTQARREWLSLFLSMYSNQPFTASVDMVCAVTQFFLAGRWGAGGSSGGGGGVVVVVAAAAAAAVVATTGDDDDDAADASDLGDEYALD